MKKIALPLIFAFILMLSSGTSYSYNTDALTAASYDSLFLVGSAIPTGWDLGSPTAMTQSEQDSMVFSWTGELTAGEFKISTYKGADAWCEGEWIHPLEQGQALSSTEFAVLMGCAEDNPDYKWEISEDTAGTYSITVDLDQETIDIAFQAPKDTSVMYQNMYLVGDATPGGWDLANQTPMQADEENGDIFTWSGTLTSGEFKFKAYKANDFCGGDWIHPLTQGQDLSSSEFEILEACVDGQPDNKWVIEEADTGAYSITLNLEQDSVAIVKEQETSISEDQPLERSISLRQNYPNPFNPSTNIEFTLPATQHVRLTVYNISGQAVRTLVNHKMSAGVHTVTFHSANLSSGIYFYKLFSGNQSMIRKMVLLK